MTGSGFYPGGVVHTTPIFSDLTIASGTNPNSLTLNYPFGQSAWSVGSFAITISSPTDGHGGGTSSTTYFSFIGNQNTLAVSPTQAFVLDQAVGQVHVFDLASGNHITDFSVSAGGLVYAIAYDDSTGHLLFPQGGNRVGIYTTTGQQLPTPQNGQAVMAAAAQGGSGCVSQDGANQIAMLDLTQVAPAMSPVAVASTPWSVAMAQFGGSNHCLVQTIGTPGLSLITFPSGQLAGFVNLTGITPSNQTSVNGGWQLAVSNSGPASGTAAALSRADQTLVLVSLNPMAETRRVTLTGDPFRIAADNVHGAFIVASADPSTGGTKFVSVNASTGVATPLTTTSSLLSAGFTVSADGTHLYVAMRNQFVVLSNN